jgi:hypothetical protein
MAKITTKVGQLYGNYNQYKNALRISVTPDINDKIICAHLDFND